MRSFPPFTGHEHGGLRAMANSLLTLNAITREAIRLFINTNAFIRNLDRQYDDQFAVAGAKIGTTLRIRLPNDYTVRSGAAAQVQDTQEQSTTLTVADQRGVDVAFNSVERTMQMDDYAERVIAPMMNNLVGKIATVIMGASEGGVANLVQNVDGSNNPLTPTSETFLTAGAMLDDNSAPGLERMMLLDPWTTARAVSGLSGLFNPQVKISEQYRSGQMSSDTLGFDFLKDQTVIKHTAGSYDSLATVNGANQTGIALTVSAINGTLALGDMITIANVNAVNRVTKETTGMSRQFCLTMAAASGATSLSIYPAITPPVGGDDVQYQTVDSAPADGALVSLVTKASTTYRKSIAFAPEAVTMVTADLELPDGVSEQARDQYDGISMRMVTQYNIGTDQKITRTDVLFGQLFIRPEWCCTVVDKV